MASETMTVAALGRSFTIGMLYDAQKDELIPGVTLWDDKTLQENTVENSQPYSAFDISASDTIESKSSLLDIDASLKASFMSGLIQVGGSAHYLNDTKKFQNQSRVTLKYTSTTHFRQLSVSTLQTTQTQQTEIIKKGLATHVVTGILYGANAFFLFDSEKLDASKKQEIQGSMEAVIKKIPSFDVKGKINIKLTDAEQDMTSKFSCKFYGDFILESNPATFVASVEAYVGLPKLLGEKGENSVPVKVWLMPLKSLHPEAVELKSVISDGLVGTMQDTLEDLRELKMRCNDSLDDRVAKNFPHIRKELNGFQKLCDYYESNLKQTMGTKLPLIRAGKENEFSAEQLLEVENEPPFSYEKLSEWLDHKEREINVIRSCVEMMEGTKIVPNQSDLDREVLAPGVDHALCFVFPSLESADPRPDGMINLDSGHTDEEQWFYSDEVLIKMREKAGSFQNLAEAQKNNSRIHFLVTAIANEKYTGATIYHYKNGILVTEDFSKPDIPSVETVKKITDRRDLIWYACDLTLDPDTVNDRLTLSEGNKKATFGVLQTYPDQPERFDTQPQVLCKEGLTVRHYWEVEWSSSTNESVYVAAAYKRADRKDAGKSFFGNNNLSWRFGQELSQQRMFYACHDCTEEQFFFPATGCNKVGVYLDWLDGTLSFYTVSSNTLSHIYTFNATFTEPLYPGFFVGNPSNYAYLSPLVKSKGKKTH